MTILFKSIDLVGPLPTIILSDMFAIYYINIKKIYLSYFVV